MSWIETMNWPAAVMLSVLCIAVAACVVAFFWAIGN